MVISYEIISHIIDHAQIERGEYKIEEGWDGIKAGFLQRPGAGQVISCQ